MPDPQFFQTPMGRTYYDHTLPRIAEALEALAQQQAAMTATMAALNANLALVAKALEAKEGTQ